jgi:hypothetical protein
LKSITTFIDSAPLSLALVDDGRDHPLAVVFDGGVAYPEEVGSLALVHPSPYGFE